MQHRVSESSSTSRPSSPLRNKIQNTPGVPFLPSYLPINPGRLILQNYRLENSAEQSADRPPQGLWVSIRKPALPSL